MASNRTSSAIIQTLRYSDHFHFPLREDELYSRLIGIKLKKLSFNLTLTSLLRAKKIGYTKGYYHLPHRSSLVARRLQSARLSAPLLARARLLSTRLSRFPSVLALYLTGSLAVNNTDGTSDIDLMIITKPSSLWTTRFLLTLYTTIFGFRRTPHSPESRGKLCLNLYLTPDSFALPLSKHSLYSAYELIQAVPLYDPTNTHSTLLSSNPWISNYLPNYSLPQYSAPTTQSANPGILENILFRLQYLYMKPKITREYITKNAAYFHPRNLNEIISLKYR